MKSLLHYTLIKKSLKWLSVSFFLLIVSTLAVYAQTYQPITVTGFNQDVVANGSGSPAASTTQAVDNNADVLYVKGYQCSPNSALGLPINGSFTSSANNSINYQFANYDANNALYLTSSSINTLNLAQPKQFVDLSFLAFSTEGSSTMTIKLNFTDGSFSGAYPFIVYDWYNGSSPAISSIGRINNGSGCLTDVFGLGAPYMYDHLIHLVGSDQQKLVQSITITNTNGTPAGNVSTNGRLLVMAVSGNAVNTPTSPLTIQSIAVTPETCAGLHNGTITVNYSNGAPPYHINLHVLSNNTFINNTPMTVTPISFFGLEPGTYEVNVGDLFGYQTRLVTINPGGTLATPVINNSTGTNVICPGSTIVLSAPASGKSLRFTDGSFVEAASSAAISLTTSLTVEAWVKTDNAGATQYIVSKGNNDQAAGQYGLVIVGGRFQFHLFKDGQFGVYGTTNIQSGVWYHVAGTWDGTTITLYVNGIAEGTNSLTGALALNNTPLQIGRLGLLLAPNFLIQYQFYGEIDEVRIWNTAKTSTEIVNNQNLSLITSASLVANYTFNEGSGTTTADLANGNTATLASDQVNFPGSTIPIWTNSNATINYQSYSWSGGQTTPSLSITSPGTYSVIVTDANGCSATSGSINIISTQPTANVITTQASCNGLTQGTISVITLTGTAPFKYSFDGGLNYQSSNSSSFALGSYSVYLKDIHECPVNLGIATISQPIDTEAPVFSQINQSGTSTVSLPATPTVSSNFPVTVNNFVDPLPAGAVITGVDLTYSAHDQNWGYTGSQSQMFINGFKIGQQIIDHNLYPGGQTVTINYSGLLPGYVYGGMNNLSEVFDNYPGWSFTFNGGTLTFHYDYFSSTKTVNSNVNDCFATVILTPPHVTDNCGILSLTNNAPAQFPKGNTTVTWTATDYQNNSATITQTVTVIDKTAPTIVNPTNTSLDACTTVIPNYTIGANVSDNCTTSASIVVTQSPDAGTSIQQGQTVSVTLTAQDQSGNTSTSSFNVTRAVAVPTAVNDAATVCAGASVVINVLNNDLANCGVLNIGSNSTPSVGTLTKNLDNTFRYTAPVNYSGAVSFTYSLGGSNAGSGTVQQLSSNGHYYEYVPAYNISWNNAKAAAAGKTYHGLQGYLTTITSAGEQTFINGILGGASWMGATDINYEGVWRWVTGPEGLEDGGQGRYFSNQTQQGPYTALTGQGINGSYVNWWGGEPNNYYTDVNSVNPTNINRPGEQYGILYFGSNSHGFWNDGGSLNVLDNSSIQGYIVEYGGIGTETSGSSSTATVNITVNASPNATITTNGSTTFCEPGSVVLSSNAATGNVWSTGVTTQSITASISGNYSVSVLASNGCSSISSPVVITANSSQINSGVSTWTTTGNLNTGRMGLTTILLPNGKVLLTGGHDGNNHLASSELYDPSTGIWTPTGSLGSARVGHTATLLLNGKVLVTGGHDGNNYISASELYDPSTGIWTPTGSMNVGRYTPTATLLLNGKVLVSSGGGDNGALLSSELYDPSTGVWTLTGNMSAGRGQHTATLLASGKVLVAGGYAGSNRVSTSELYDPATGNWTVTGSLSIGRNTHTATLLPNGNVLVTGGGDGNSYLTSSELYDPSTGNWTPTGNLNEGRNVLIASLLSNGKVLVAGGVGVNGFLTSSELYDPSTGAWTSAGNMSIGRYIHSAVQLSNGKVLVTGGYNSNNGYLSSTEIYGALPVTVSITGNNTLCANTTIQLSASQSGGVWSSETPSVATINSVGLVSSIGAGTATLTYTLTNEFGCQRTYSHTVIVNPTPNQPVVTSTSILICNGGSQLLTLLNFDETYTYQWRLNQVDIPGANGGTYTATSIGNYSVLATNAEGCTLESPMHILVAPDPFVVSINQVNQSCAQYNSGFANIAYSGGKAPYTVEWFAGIQSLGTAEAIGNLAPGTYTVTATDACGAQSQASVTITRLPGIVVPNITASGPLVLCSNSNLTLSFPGVQGYTGVWTKSIGNQYTDNYSTNASITVSESGNYGVYIQEPNGCRNYSNNFFVAPLATNPFHITTSKGPVCSEYQKGYVDLVFTGGSGPYTFEGWKNASNQFIGTPNEFYKGNLDAGFYTASAHDACATTYIATVELVNTPPLVLPTVTASGPYCNGNPVTLTLSPTSYSFEWLKWDPVNQTIVSFSPNQSVITVSDPGYYYYPSVKDIYGCYGYPTGVSLNPTPPITMTINSTGIYCSVSQKGTANVTTVSGGTSPYSYSWKDGSNNIISTTSLINNLDPGSYSVTITDACGNTATQTASIIASPAIILPTITADGPITFCNGGSVNLTLSQTPNLTYHWFSNINNVTTFDISLTHTLPVSTTGFYSAYVVDINGCSASVPGLNVNVSNANLTKPIIQANSTTFFCEGGSVELTITNPDAAVSYQWKLNGINIVEATGTTYAAIATGNYSVVGSTVGGCTGESGTINVTVNPTPATPVITTPASTTACFPNSITLAATGATNGYNWKNGTNTFFGNTYNVGTLGVSSITVFTTSQFGCSSVESAPITITINTAPNNYGIFTASGSSYCSGGTGVAISLGGSQAGVNYTLYQNGIATTSVIAGTGLSISFPNVTLAADYTIKATDATSGCDKYMNGIITVTVKSSPTTPIISGPSNISSCTNTNIGLSATGGNSADYTWFNSNGNYTFAFGLATANYLFSNPGTYTASVKSTVNGCTVTSAPVTFTIGARPNSVSLNAPSGTNYCAGGSGITINSGSSQVGFNYELIRNGATTGIILAGTGSALSFTGNTIAGSYQVNATNLSGGCGVMSGNIITVSILANPTIFTVSASGPLCAYSTFNVIRLSGSETGVTYRRSIDGGTPVAVFGGNGSAINTSIINTAGTYTYSAIRGACVSDMTGSVIVAPNTLAIPTITASGPTSFCLPGSVTLTGSPASAYSWNTGATTSSITANQSAFYSLRVSDFTTGCQASAIPVQVSAYPPPDAPGIWSYTDTMKISRYHHTATSLADGKILIVGGISGSAAVASSEIYNPVTGKFTNTGSLNIARDEHSAILLPMGKVLVTGGTSAAALSSTELYDPATGTWSLTGNMITERYQTDNMVLLLNGKVLIAGGINKSNATLNSAELYDPSTGIWTTTDTLKIKRSGHTTTLLADGKVLVSGGLSNGIFVNSSEIYNPATGKWTTTGSMTVNRRFHSATLLSNGKVLVSGGNLNANPGISNTAEIFNPATGTWTATGSMTIPRFDHASRSVLLNNGQVMVAGGLGSYSVSNYSTELYDPATGVWDKSATLNASRTLHTLTLLNNGKVLATGTSTVGSTKTTELYSINTPVSISGINTICAGTTTQLTATVSGGVWTAINPTIATVDAGGVVMGVTGGAARIGYTVTNVYGCSSTYEYTINVTAINDQTITTGLSSICGSGNSTVSLASSEIGVNYTLRNNANNSIVAGPINGTGSDITFNTGTLSTTTTFNVLAKMGGSGALNYVGNAGSGSYVSVPHNNAYNLSSITLEAMVYFNGSDNIGNIVMKGDYGWGMGITSSGTLEWWNQYYQNQGPNSTIGAVPAGQWSHIAVTVGGGQTKFYINGVLNATANEAIINNKPGPLYFGRQGETCNCNFFNGKLDEIRIWNTVRTAAEIAANTSTCLTGSEPGLVSLFKFNDASGTTAVDSKGLSNGSLNNFNPAKAWTTGNPSIVCGNGLACTYQLSTTPTVTVNTLPVANISANGPTTFCAGGTVTLTASPGTTYLWSTGAITPSINVTTSGNYSVTITNASGCSASSAATTVTVITVPTATSSKVDVDCLGNNTGIITVIATGGIAPNQYSKDGGVTYQPSNIFSGLSVGNYGVYVKDANSCPVSVGIVNIVNAIDITPPSIICPANISVNATNASGATVTYSTPSGSDNCSGTNLAQTSGLASGSTFPLGVNVVTYIATDASGNTATCSFTITVAGATPVVVCPANITVDNANGQCGANVTFNATDNTGSPASTITYSKNPGTFFPVGTTTVTATATNSIGQNSCSFTVTVLDKEKPTIACSSDITATASGILGAIVTYPSPIPSDNCSGTIVTRMAGLASGSTFPIGANIVTYLATDASGNTATCSFTITVVGRAPVITCAGEVSTVTVPNRCGTNVFYSIPATDNTGFPASTITYSIPSGSFFPFGVTTVTATATNVIGVSTCTFTVRVFDNIPPVINCPLPILVKCSSDVPPVNTGSVTASDNCSVVVTWVSDVISNQTAINKYTITRWYRATDPSGNSNDCSQIITVNDNVVPIITCTANISVPATGPNGAIVNYLEPTATDNCSGVPTVVMQEGSLPSGTMFPIGVSTVTYVATDASGNMATCSFTITVVDVVAPVIACIPSITQNTDPGVCGAIVNYKIPVVEDNTSSITVNVTEGFGDGAIEFITPLSKNVNSISFESSGNYQDIAHGHGISINVNVELFNPSTNAWNLIKTIVTGTGDYHFGGTAIEFPVMSQVSKIRFTTSQPIFAGLHLYQMDINLNSIGLIQRAGLPSGSLFPVGVTNNVFEATDGSGNTSTCSFDVTVLDKEKPIVATVPSIIKNAVANCFWNGSAGTLSIQDACTGSMHLSEKYFDQNGNVLYSVLSIISGTSYPLTSRNFPVGKNKAVITVTDANGNESAIVSFDITVIDNVKPTITTTGNKTYGTDPSRCGRDVVIATPVVTDNCSIKSIVNNINGYSFINQRFSVGTTVVTWTATDNNGNTSTATQRIIIVDTEKPTISRVPVDINQTNDLGVCGAKVSWPALLITDPCGVSNVSSNYVSGQLFPVGNTVVTYNATDVNGNTSTASFTITVTDNEAPKVITRNITVTLVNGLATITPAQINNGSTDNCAGTLAYALSKTQFTCANIGANQVTLNVTDANNNTAGVTATVTVIGVAPVSTIVVTPSNNTYTGGVATNLYLGYGPQSVTLTNVITGGTATNTYSWTGTGLSCTTCAAPVFTATVAGNYQYMVTTTNSFGCSVISAVNICVQDIRVTGSLGSIYICRLNLSTGVSTSVVTVVGTSTTLLSPTTLDKLGACNMAPCSPPSGLVLTTVTPPPPVATTPTTGTTINKVTAEMATPVVENKLSAKASPNPSTDVFTIIVFSKDTKTPVHVRMLDGSGRLTETRNNVALSSSFKMGAQLIPGVYYAEVIQGKERVVLKLIKQNR